MRTASPSDCFRCHATLRSASGRKPKHAKAIAATARCRWSWRTRTASPPWACSRPRSRMKSTSPITGAVTNAQAALRWLCARPPNLEEVQQALGRIVSNGLRAGNVVERIRSLITKAPPRKDRVDINEAIREVIELTRSDAVKNGVAVQADLTDGLPLIDGDRVQLQQVIINLVMNAVQAMSNASDGTRELSISSGRTPDGVLVTVKDSGPGLPPATLERLFEAFYTTKPGGLGLGLSICRSIIDAHGGRLWASANVPRGAIFHVAVPAYPDSAS